MKGVWSKPSQRWPLMFFVACLALAGVIFGHYGVSWDEKIQRQHGFVSARYVNEVLPYSDARLSEFELEEYMFRHYGVWFTLPMVWVEQALGLEGDRQIYRARHAATFLLYWLGGIGFYQILRLRFGSWRWALLGAFFYFLSPRLFGHAFFNPKDIPFLALFVFSSWTLFRFWQRPAIGTGALHALACGMLISMRIVGVLLPVMTLFLFLADALLGKKGTVPKGRSTLAGFAAYLPLTAGFTTLFWPYLWADPLGRFWETFREMSKYGWGGQVVFEGRWLYGTELPWYYIPKWVVMSVPLLYLLLLGVGVGFLISRAVQNLRQRPFRLWASTADRMDWGSLGLLTAPVVAIIVLDSVVYDGWRHLFFIYPSLLYLSVVGAEGVWRRAAQWEASFAPSLRYALSAVLLGNLLWLSVWMVRNHPYQHVYFNLLNRENKLGIYDLDYWGTSYKTAFFKIAAMDDREHIKVLGGSYPALLNRDFLPPGLRYRFEMVSEAEEAHYYMTTYRSGQPKVARALAGEGIFKNEEVFALEVAGSKILGVYRLDGGE
jgi:hypothetical protein